MVANRGPRLSRGDHLPGRRKLHPHSRDSFRDTLMRDKHHLVLDTCTTYTHKNRSKLWLQQTDQSNYWGLAASAKTYVTTRTTPSQSCVSFLLPVQLSMTAEGASFSPSHSPRTGGRAIFRLHVKPAYLWFVLATASLVCPLPIPGPPVTLRHLPFATGGHVIALWRGHVLSG